MLKRRRWTEPFPASPIISRSRWEYVVALILFSIHHCLNGLPEPRHSCTVSAHSCNLALCFSSFDVISSRVSVCCRTFCYVPLLSLSHGCLCTDLFDGYKKPSRMWLVVITPERDFFAILNRYFYSNCTHRDAIIRFQRTFCLKLENTNNVLIAIGDAVNKFS